jgi:hypothetical protein
MKSKCTREGWLEEVFRTGQDPQRVVVPIIIIIIIIIIIQFVFIYMQTARRPIAKLARVHINTQK